MLSARHWDLASWQSCCIDLAGVSFESRLHLPSIHNVFFASACGVALSGIGTGGADAHMMELLPASLHLSRDHRGGGGHCVIFTWFSMLMWSTT